MKKIWDDKNDHLLGTMPDTEIARKLKLNWYVPFSRRRKLNIKAFRPNKNEEAKKYFKSLNNDELMTPIYLQKKFYSRQFHYFLKEERERRGLRAKGYNQKFIIGKLKVKSVMIKAALEMRPQPTLTEIADIFKTTHQAVGDFIKKNLLPVDNRKDV